jgi:hypothetical protein
MLRVRYDGEHPENLIRTICVGSHGDVDSTSQDKPAHISVLKIKKKRLSSWLGCESNPDKVFPVRYEFIARRQP